MRKQEKILFKLLLRIDKKLDLLLSKLETEEQKDDMRGKVQQWVSMLKTK